VRVVFASAADLARLPGSPRPLGKTRSGAWLALADDALLAAWALGTKLDVLYLSVPAMEHALRKLDEKARAEAIEERRRIHASNALDQSTSWLGDRARRVIAMSKPAHAARVLAQLVPLETAGRYDMLSPREKLFGLLEAEAGLLAELADARPDLTAEIAARKRFYEEDARGLEKLGQKGLVDAPLVVGVTRVYAVTPAAPAEAYFLAREEPQVRLGEAQIGPLAVKDVARWREAGRKVELVLPARGDLFATLELTAAQRELELAVPPDLDGHLFRLRVDQNLRKRAFASPQVAADTALLPPPVAGDVAGAEVARAADAKFLAAWAKLAGRLELGLSLAAHAEQITKDAKDL
jgi:hypothetical protein